MPRRALEQVTPKDDQAPAIEQPGQVPAVGLPEPGIRRGGRPKAFEEATVKVALFLPSDLIGSLKALAARSRSTPSLVVAEWIRKAEIREAIARGRQDFEKGDVASHEEALERLAKW